MNSKNGQHKVDFRALTDQSTTKGLNYLDGSVIQRLWGPKLPVKDIAQIYLEELPQVIDSIGNACFIQGSFKELGLKAHGLKGSFGMLGAERVVSLASELETAAAGRDRQQADHLCLRLVGTLKHVEKELSLIAQEG